MIVHGPIFRKKKRFWLNIGFYFQLLRRPPIDDECGRVVIFEKNNFSNAKLKAEDYQKRGFLVVEKEYITVGILRQKLEVME